MPKPYRPQLKFADLFANRLERPCLNTGKIVRLTPRFRNIRQGMNAVALMGILLYSFRGNVGASLLEFLLFFAALCAMIAALALANFLVLRMASYEEVLKEAEEEAEELGEEDTEETRLTAVLFEQTEEERAAKEQKESLVALYAKYEKEYQESHPKQSFAGKEAVEGAVLSQSATLTLADLELVWDWRAYFPGTVVFKTNHAGVQLLMPIFYKKLMNIVLMVLMMGAFFTMRYSALVFYLTVLAALVLGFVAQQICVRYLVRKKLWEIKS